ncbi:glycoside hydrolase family 31 protein, partial [Aureobasidium melanogenum]
QHNLVLPVIQGFIGQRAFTIDTTENAENKIVDAKQEASEVVKTQEEAQKENATTTNDKSQAKELLLTLISRRSVKRAGLRYLRRGIDDDGNVANNVETEQILATPSWDTKDKVFSFLQVRGSIPLFFSQSPYSFKPIPIQYGSEATNQAAFEKHFSNMLERYGEVQCASLVDKHGTEAKIGESYEKHANDLNTSGGVSGKQVGFHWFDFHTVCKGMKFENVSILMDTLRPAMKSFGWTVQQDGKLLSTQTGVLRTNCMDCLDRTNVVQSGAAGHALQDQLAEMGLSINLQTDPKTSWYNNLWADNGDAISRQYAGTAALKGDFTRTRKRNWQGALTDFSLTLNRYYNNIFGDYFLQTCIDFWLGNAGPVVFEEFETDMMNQDYALDMGRVRQSAIETCVRIVLEDSADMISGWTLSCPASANTLRALPFEECIVLLTDSALYFCRFDWDTEKVGSFERVELIDIESVNYGTYITSTLGPTHMDEKKNVGFVVKYSSQTPAMVRTNTRSLANEKEASAADKDTKKTSLKPAESRLLAFKALPPRNSASKGKNTDAFLILLLCLLEIIGSMMFPRFKRAALFALPAAAAVSQTTSSDATKTADANIIASTYSGSTASVLLNGTYTTFTAQYTLPAAVDNGANLIPNVEDPQAKVAQSVCPGYKASNVMHNQYGFSATLNLAGQACNVYGTDVDVLNLTVAYQSAHRLAVEISPAHVTAENATWYILPSDQVYKPEQTDEVTDDSDLQFVWSNDP